MIENDLIEWISNIKKEHPVLGGFAICPYAKYFDYKIEKISINDIHPLEKGYGVVIFVVEDDISLETARNKCAELNRRYPKYTFFEDWRDDPSFIHGVKTNNGKYNLILYQNRELLRKLRIKLASSGYYDLWDDEYLQKILENDYEIVQKNRNK
jgi:hypothetical protein